MISSAALPFCVSLLLAGVLSAPPGLKDVSADFGSWNPSGGNGGGGNGGGRGVDYDNSGSWGNNNNHHNNNNNNGGNYRRTIEIATYDYDDGYNSRRPNGYRRPHRPNPNRGGYGPPMNQYGQEGGYGRSSYGYQGRNQQSHSSYGPPQSQYDRNGGYGGNSNDYNDYQDTPSNQNYGPPRKSSYGYQGPVNIGYTPPAPKKSSYGYQGAPPPQESSYGRKSSYGYQGAARANAEAGPDSGTSPLSPPVPSFSKTPNRPHIQTPPAQPTFETNLSPEQKAQLDDLQRQPLLPPLPSTDNVGGSFGQQGGNQSPPSSFNEQPSIPSPPFAPPPPTRGSQNPPFQPSIPSQQPSIPQPQSEFRIPAPPVPSPPPPMDGSNGPPFSIPQAPPPPPPPPMDGGSGRPSTPQFGDAPFSADVKTEFKIPTPPPPPPPPPMDG